MRTIIDIDDSEDEKPVIISVSSNPKSTKTKDILNEDKSAVVSVHRDAAKIKDEPNGDQPLILSATKKSNATKIKHEDKPMVVSATNNPVKPSVPKIKKEEDNPDDAAKAGSALSGFVDQNVFEDVDGDDDESGDEIVDSKYVGLADINGVQHFVCEGFKIRQIPEPFVIKRSLHDLNACIIANSIILDPEYQRDVVWEEGRASMLIASILMGYFIPPIIFNVKKLPQKTNGVKYLRICVDGKQRLTSVWKFMTGRIGFMDTSTPQRKWYYCHRQEEGRTIEDPNRNILPQAIKDFFQKQYFCCYEYDSLDLDTEETMFQLVQRGVALTSAEKMRAMSTEWAKYTKQFEEEYEVVMNLSKNNRATGFRLILTIFSMIQEVTPYIGKRKKYAGHKSGPILKASPLILSRILDDKTPIDPGLKVRYKAVFDRYESLVKLCSAQFTRTRWRVLRHSIFDPNPPFLYQNDSIQVTKTFSPIEYVAVAILIEVHMDRTDDELLSDIAAFRTHIRKYHRDLRVNAQCWVTAWAFISTEMDKRIKDPSLVEPAPEGKRSELSDHLKSKRSVFSRSNAHAKGEKRHTRSGSSSSLSSIPSDILDDFDEEEMEEDVTPGPSQARRKKKQKEKQTRKGKEKRKPSARDSEETTERRSKRARQSPDVDYSAEFPNLDLRANGVMGGIYNW